MDMAPRTPNPRFSQTKRIKTRRVALRQRGLPRRLLLRVRRIPAAVHRQPTPSDSNAPPRKSFSIDSLTAELERASPVTVPSHSLQHQRHWLCSHDVWVPLMSLVGFSSIAFLVFAAEPGNLLLTCDHSIQEWIVSTIPLSVRDVVFEQGISNLFILFDLVVGTSLLLIHGTGNQSKGWTLTGLSALFFYAGVGSHTYEGWIVHFLKEAFHRCRPQTGMISYAFPSGHVTSAVFLTGALLFVWLPATVGNLDEDAPSFVRFYVGALDRVLENRSLFWGLSFLCTMVGRVGGNVHWVSDTLAGGLLGIALTSLLVSLHTALNERLSRV